MKKTTLCLGIFLAMVFAVQPATGQEASTVEGTAYERFARGLGFSGGLISGVGLSYRQWSDRFGYQVVAGGYYYPAESWEFTSMDYWVSAEGFYRMYSAEFADWFFNQLYLFAGVIHHGYMHGAPYQAEIGAGAGFGIEVGWFQHLSTSFEIGYAAFWPFKVELAVQGAFHYRF